MLDLQARSKVVVASQEGEKKKASAVGMRKITGTAQDRLDCGFLWVSRNHKSTSPIALELSICQ